MDEELVVRSCPERGGQLFNVQMNISDKWCPSGVCTGTMLFNIFIDDTDSGIECTFCKFVDDTKLCGAADMPKGWDAIWRYLCGLKKWARECKIWVVATSTISTGWRI